jgi:hypothetical protein
MAKVDPKVTQAIAKLEASLLTDEMKANKQAREATEKTIKALKIKHGIK